MNYVCSQFIYPQFLHFLYRFALHRSVSWLNTVSIHTIAWVSEVGNYHHLKPSLHQGHAHGQPIDDGLRLYFRLCKPYNWMNIEISDKYQF